MGVEITPHKNFHEYQVMVCNIYILLFPLIPSPPLPSRPLPSPLISSPLLLPQTDPCCRTTCISHFLMRRGALMRRSFCWRLLRCMALEIGLTLVITLVPKTGSVFSYLLIPSLFPSSFRPPIYLLLIDITECKTQYFDTYINVPTCPLPDFSKVLTTQAMVQQLNKKSREVNSILQK